MEGVSLFAGCQVKGCTIKKIDKLAFGNDGATIGARLHLQAAENCDSKFDSFFWSDSTIVISWIQRDEWITFVTSNPADLPSRGCTPKQLFESRWWEGPTWLYLDRGKWPSEKKAVNEKEVVRERKKKLLKSNNPQRKLCRSVGTQSLPCLLREEYWILRGRRTIKSVLRKCVLCRRFDTKPFVVEPPPLPVDRVHDAVAFEITGVDFAGPLYFKSGEKAYSDPIKLGDIVVIGNDNVKRIEWPISRVVELIPGKDGRTRLVRVKTTPSIATTISVGMQWPTIGIHSLHPRGIENGEKFIEFAAEHKLKILGTFYDYKSIHKGTWRSPNGTTLDQIDNFAVEERHKSRVYRNADADTDHFLTVLKMTEEVASKKTTFTDIAFEIPLVLLAVVSIASTNTNSRSEAIRSFYEELDKIDKDELHLSATTHSAIKKQLKFEIATIYVLNMISQLVDISMFVVIEGFDRLQYKANILYHYFKVLNGKLDNLCFSSQVSYIQLEKDDNHFKEKVAYARRLCLTYRRVCNLIDSIRQCSVTSAEALKSGSIANEKSLEVSMDDSTQFVHLYRRQLKILTMQAYCRQPAFSAAGYFIVNYSVVLSVMGAICSYFIILLQFREQKPKV
ncbi:hypothetical protein ILUMI_19698 [Ignelater luminosus]|uniref:Gustatory receptor n=1 Tax=Ignelater luminosus TaxID=2038154 RepID=A0A8K0CIT0_IGNLU|nr:hypothetical protein ILUMI_19698 [Ignelater luminosus]